MSMERALVAELANGPDPGSEVLAGSSALRERLRQPGSSLRRVKEFVIEKFLLLCGFLSVAAIMLIFGFLFQEGAKALKLVAASEYVSSMVSEFAYDAELERAVEVGQVRSYRWQPVGDVPKLSLVPLLWGSLSVALLSALLSTVAGVGVGVYLAEIATRRLRDVVKPALELLVGIPTVVIGFFMLAVVAIPMKTLADYLGLGGVYRDTYNAWVAALGVSIVIVPVIASLVDDALRAVPDDLRAASFAMGATRWQTIRRVVLPAGVSGVFAAMVLGFGRALGETMIVLMCAGNAAQVSGNPFDSVRTMTASIAAEMGSAQQGGVHALSLFLVGAVLVTFTFVLNLTVELIVSRYRNRIRH